jgi:Fic family protein
MSTLTLEETALVLKEGVTVNGKPLKHHVEAISHRDAYYFIEDLVKNKVPVSERAIQEIHTLVLMDRQMDKGVYRSVPVGLTSFTPTSLTKWPYRWKG